MATINSSHLIDELRTFVQPGDLLLAGGDDGLSRLIRYGTASEFSHVGVVIDDNLVVEAWEQKFTPTETDNGVVTVPLSTFAERDMSHLKVVRPHDLDAEQLMETAERLATISAPFPSVGAIVLAACVGSRRMAAMLPKPIQRRLLTFQVRLAGDGSLTMQCAETATRLYVAAGVALWFPNHLLATHVEHVRDHPDLELQPDGEVDFVAQDPSASSLGIVKQHRFGPGKLLALWRDRWNTRPDQYDFVLPVDLDNSPSFSAVVSYTHADEGWSRVDQNEAWN